MPDAIILDIAVEAEGVPQGAKALMSRAACAACRREGITGVGAGVRIVTDEVIHEINRLTRGVDRPTDVLSFPTVSYPRGTAKDNVKRVRREYDPELKACYIGDIVISIDRARAQALEYGHALARELGYLTAHATLHLLGYDHMTDGDRAVMRGMEEAIMADITLPREGGAITDTELFEKACSMLDMAYAPYSRFHVGAAILTDDGRVFTGCNIENASYGATICAERVAAVKAVSEGARGFEAIAIAGETAPAWPCGVCRQFLREFGKNMRVLVGARSGDNGGTYTETTLEALLPESFGPESLEV